MPLTLLVNSRMSLSSGPHMGGNSEDSEIFPEAASVDGRCRGSSSGARSWRTRRATLGCPGLSLTSIVDELDRPRRMIGPFYYDFSHGVPRQGSGHQSPFPWPLLRVRTH
jgi:hypothetical protein